MTMAHAPKVRWTILFVLARIVICTASTQQECSSRGFSSKCEQLYNNSNLRCCKCNLIDCDNGYCDVCPSDPSDTCVSDSDCSGNLLANTCYLGRCWIQALFILLWTVVGLVIVSCAVFAYRSLMRRHRRGFTVLSTQDTIPLYHQ